MEELIRIDTIDDYNKMLGKETKHPLVTVVDMKTVTPEFIPQGDVAYSYGVYALFLKQTYCGDITYGRQPYDYQEGTVTSFAPGQVIHVKHKDGYKPNALGLLFHSDLISGTSLGRDIGRFNFFSYSSTEALHLSEKERKIYTECLANIDAELDRGIDRHTRPLICRNIELLLEYCMRFYDRQFVTREHVNHDVLVRFERLLNEYFEGRKAAEMGLPSVKYFAEHCFLSSNYFGDLVKKETGRTPMEMIQAKVMDIAKNELLGTSKTISEISEKLGFQYSQHFNRYFKKSVGMTPSEYRRQL